MRLSPKTKHQLRLQNVLFLILLLLLTVVSLALSHRFNSQSDWSKHERNTLSDTSIRLLGTLDGTLYFKIFATDKEIIRRKREELILKYRRAYDKVQYEFINPEVDPALAREQGISKDGEVIITLGDSSEKLARHNEQAYTNAIQRLARSADRWLIFLSGHGERNPLGKANHDLGEWGKQLQSKGLKIQTLNLAKQPIIPVNTSALVIAGPQTDYLAGELNLIKRFINQGGNLFWLAEPGSLYKLDTLSQILPVEFPRGMLVEPSTQMLGISNPFIALATEYPPHDITKDMNVTTLFPQTRPVKAKESADWETKVLLSSLPRSWVETSEFKGNVGFDQGMDTMGPVSFGLSLTRSVPIKEETGSENGGTKQQRIVIIGDGDFLSNSYLGNGGNSNLGLYIANWLSHDDKFISIPVKTAVGTQLNWSPTVQLILGFGFLFFIPLLLAGSGTFIWLKRRKR